MRTKKLQTVSFSARDTRLNLRLRESRFCTFVKETDTEFDLRDRFERLAVRNASRNAREKRFI